MIPPRPAKRRGFHREASGLFYLSQSRRIGRGIDTIVPILFLILGRFTPEEAGT
jgi:hypothetical protein